MSTYYHKWLEIEVINGYFKNGMCTSFQLVPFIQTSKILKNYNIMIQKQGNRFVFYVGSSENTAFKIANEFKALDALYFQVLTNDPLFFNYTDIPPTKLPQLFFFTNTNGTVNLQKKKEVSKADIITIKQKCRPQEITNKDELIEIKNSKGITIQKEPDAEEKHSTINLKQLKNGCYQLWINKKLVEQFYHFETDFLENCLGVLQLDIKEVIKSANENLKLTLNFKERSVFWQYQIVIPKEWNEEDVDLEIQGVHGDTYKNSLDQKIIGGQTSKVFISASPNPLQADFEKTPLLKVAYSDTFSNKKNELEIALPNLEAEKVRTLNTEAGISSLCSSTIVYI